MVRWSLVLAIAISAPACRKKPAAGDDVSLTPTPTAPAGPAVPVAPAPVPAEALAQLKANFTRVHFDFDRWDLDAASRERLVSNARVLGDHPSVVVEIQGHADERGTTDYNLALGEKRAATVRSFLLGAGVPSERLRTISYGEERPSASGVGETVWAENRRAEFRILAGSGVAGTTGE
jgi:peptidoglycan-associated lipoprotein